jgi:hypothetical protein
MNRAFYPEQIQSQSHIKPPRRHASRSFGAARVKSLASAVGETHVKKSLRAAKALLHIGPAKTIQLS